MLTKDVTKASVKESDIQVILVDYGCLESVGLTTLKVMKEDHCILHPAGCKAYLGTSINLNDTLDCNYMTFK